MNNLKLIAGITALVSLLATIIATPALAQEKSSTVVFKEERITVKVQKCVVRELDQGTGKVRICE